jgi:DNA-directed RNA polymerase subunit RPC12/RpoP
MRSEALSLVQPRAPRAILAYPRLPTAYELPPGWEAVHFADGVDALAITTRHLSDDVLEQLVRRTGDPLIPVISLVDDDRWWLDASARGGSWNAWQKAEDILRRLAELPPSIRNGGSTEELLLARMYSRNAPLDPIYNAAVPELISYPVAGLLKGVAEAANRLVETGHLARRFFERMHVCADCGASLLSVREECRACRSPNLVEQSIVHHFRCGHEANEESFRTGTALQCPKCGDALRHIGLDYDKPGSVVQCRACGHVDDIPAVGFVCLNCGHHRDSEQMPRRDWYSYVMTALGTQQLLLGRISVDGPARPAAPFRLLLEHLVRAQASFGTPFRVLQLQLPQAEGDGSRRHEQVLHLILDGLRSALRPVDTIAERPEGFLVLLPHAGDAEAMAAIAHIRVRLAEILQDDVVYRLDVLPADAIEPLLRG